jgi:hypothetical protein
MIFKKLFAWGFLSFSFVFLTMAIAMTLKPNATGEDRKTALGGLILGGPPLAAGIWILRDLKAKNLLQQNQRFLSIEQEFLRILVQNNGYISTAQLALSGKITLKESEDFLQEKAIQLNAYHEVDEQGRILYNFSNL